MLWGSLANPLPCPLPAPLLATRSHTVYIMFYINLTLNTQVWQTIRPTACSSISPKAFINSSLTVVSPAASPLPLPSCKQRSSDCKVLTSITLKYLAKGLIHVQMVEKGQADKQKQLNGAYLSRVYPAIAERDKR